MTIKLPIVLLIISLFLTTAPFSAAQAVRDDWGAVPKIVSGTDLFVKTSNGKTVRGTFTSADDNKIELFVKGSRLSLSKSQVESIYLGRRKSGKRARLIGAGVGFAAGLLASVTFNKDAELESDYNYTASAFLSIGGLVGGAFVGGLFGKGKKKGVLVYKAR